MQGHNPQDGNSNGYYILENDEVKGPYTIDQLRSMWISGALTGDTFYSQDGYEKWLQLWEIANVLELPSPVATPGVAGPQLPVAPV
jgi:hypothetical protein